MLDNSSHKETYLKLGKQADITIISMISTTKALLPLFFAIVRDHIIQTPQLKQTINKNNNNISRQFLCA